MLPNFSLLSQGAATSFSSLTAELGNFVMELVRDCIKTTPRKRPPGWGGLGMIFNDVA